jgi:hypothetical protein
VAGKVAVPHRAAGGCLQLIIYHLERRLSSAGECRIIALSEITEPMEKQTGAALHGLFTLVAGVSEQEFLLAFEAFYGHLKEREFVRGYRMMRRQPLEGFGAALPDFDYHVEIEFLSLEQDQACFDYVKKNEEPIRSLHRALNSKVKRGEVYFFLDLYI